MALILIDLLIDLAEYFFSCIVPGLLNDLSWWGTTFYFLVNGINKVWAIDPFALKETTHPVLHWDFKILMCKICALHFGVALLVISSDPSCSEKEYRSHGALRLRHSHVQTYAVQCFHNVISANHLMQSNSYIYMDCREKSRKRERERENLLMNTQNLVALWFSNNHILFCLFPAGMGSVYTFEQQSGFLWLMPILASSKAVLTGGEQPQIFWLTPAFYIFAVC